MSVAMLFFLGSMIYYLRLNMKIALYVLCSFGPLLLLAEYCAHLPFWSSFKVFCWTFVLGWVFQLTGHYFEGRRPALADNIMQVFNAPVFLVCEVLFFSGKFSSLKEKIEAELQNRSSLTNT
jgi:uncharacterized membrane protein YGL010W